MPHLHWEEIFDKLRCCCFGKKKKVPFGKCCATNQVNVMHLQKVKNIKADCQSVDESWTAAEQKPITVFL